MRLAAMLTAMLVTSAVACSAAFAQADSCESVLRYGVFDKQSTTNVQNRFSQLKTFVCQSASTTLSQLNSSASALGLEIPDLVNLNVGGKNAQSNFSEWKEAFCRSDFSELSANSDVRNEISRASDAILKAWQGCIEHPPIGFFIYAIPGEGYGSFTVNVINRVSGVPQKLTVQRIVTSPDVKCDIEPGHSTNAQTDSFSCLKPPEHAADITLVTDPAGASNTVRVPGRVGDEILDLQAQLNALSARNAALDRRLTDTYQTLKSALTENHAPVVAEYEMAPDPNHFNDPPFMFVRRDCPQGTFVSGAAARHNTVVPKEAGVSLTSIFIYCSKFPIP